MAEGERVEEVLSEPEEDMDIGATPAKEIVPGNYSPGTTWEMIQDLSGEERANTATPPLGSPRKNLDLQPGSKPVDMGIVFSSNNSNKKKHH